MLTRRRMIAATLAAPALRAQIGYRDYARCLPDYLSSLAAAVYSRRNQRLAALRTPADIRSYQAWARTTFTRLVGTLPERSPLNIRTLGAIERDRYRVEKLVYESRPGLFVTVNLYLPKTGAGPYPGVLFQMGHSAPGKAYPLYQRCCQGLGACRNEKAASMSLRKEFGWQRTSSHEFIRDGFHERPKSGRAMQCKSDFER
jgi:hypothetical protein